MPRPVDLESKGAFLNFIRGAISSISEAMGRKQKLRTEYRPWKDDLASPPDQSMRTPAENAELSDLQSQLFPLLRSQAPRRLKRTIDAWEAVFHESYRIPARGHRRYVSEVKALFECHNQRVLFCHRACEAERCTLKREQRSGIIDAVTVSILAPENPVRPNQSGDQKFLAQLLLKRGESRNETLMNR